MTGIGHSVAKVNGSEPPSGNSTVRMRTGASAAAATPTGATAALTRRSASRRATAQAAATSAANSAATGLARAVSTASPAAVSVTPALQRERDADARQQAEGEGEPAGVEVDRGRGAEPQRAQPGLAAEAPAGQRLEHRRRGHGRQRSDELRGEQRRQGRKQDAVAGGVVPGVPVVVPQAEALDREQLGPEQVGGEVEARGRDDHVTAGEHEGGHDRGHSVPRRGGLVGAPARAVAVALTGSPRRSRLLQEGGDRLDRLGLLQPRPMACPGDLLHRRVRQERGYALRVLAGLRGLALAVEHERGDVGLGQERRQLGEVVGACRAMEAQDGALSALVKLLPGRVDARARSTPADWPPGDAGSGRGGGA